MFGIERGVLKWQISKANNSNKYIEESMSFGVSTISFFSSINTWL
jgi:hypothetical protein